MNTERLKERIEMMIVEEVQATNLISQREPENYIPVFIQRLANRMYELVLDEITFK